MNTIELKHIPDVAFLLSIEDGMDDSRAIKRLSLHTTDYKSVAAGYGNLSENFPTTEQAIAYFRIFAASPLLLSALIKAVEDHGSLEAWFNAHKSNMRTEYPVPDWVNEAKAAIAAAGVTVKAKQS